jgi:hypothetical protein
MTYFIRIFCQSEQAIPCYNIGQVIEDGVYFDAQPEFMPALNSTEARQPDWTHFQIRYDNEKQPIILTCNRGDALFESERDELITHLPHLVQMPIQRDLIDSLTTAAQLITIELDRDDLSEEAWAMLDALEAYLAETLGGLIYAPDDAFYGSGLELLYKIR